MVSTHHEGSHDSGRVGEDRVVDFLGKSNSIGCCQEASEKATFGVHRSRKTSTPTRTSLIVRVIGMVIAILMTCLLWLI